MSWSLKGWSDGFSPDTPGWYAQILFWSSYTGISLSADKWDGKKWSAERAPVIAYKGPFADKAAAIAWAYNHDPDFPS